MAEKKPKGARGTAWGILNPWGDVWTHNTFTTSMAASAHIDEFWDQPGFGPTDRSKFRVVPVEVQVTYSPPKAAAISRSQP